MTIEITGRSSGHDDYTNMGVAREFFQLPGERVAHLSVEIDSFGAAQCNERNSIGYFCRQNIGVHGHLPGFQIHFYTDATELAANVMRSATSLGYETIAAWLDATLRISAPMRFAMNSSACGGIIWLSVATMDHDGRVFHTGGPAFAVKESTLSGFCTAAIMRASVGSTSPANAIAKQSRSIHRKP